MSSQLICHSRQLSVLKNRRPESEASCQGGRIKTVN